MRTLRCGLFLVGMMAFSWTGYAQHKCDVKEVKEGAELPPCRQLESGGRYCPVLKGRNGMVHPNSDKFWAHPEQKDDYEVVNMPVGLSRAGVDACLEPLPGYAWADPTDKENFALSGQAAADPNQPCVSMAPNGIRVLGANTPCKQPEIKTASAAVASSNGITVDGSYKHNSPKGQWGRGMPTTMYCGNSPESWIRGNATLDPSSGLLSLTVELETDSTSAGPKGRVVAALRDANGKTIATASSDEIGTGGKVPGSAAIRIFTSQTTIDPAVATQVTSIYLDAQCTGSVDRIFNIKMDTVNDAFKIAVAISSL